MGELPLISTTITITHDKQLDKTYYARKYRRIACLDRDIIAREDYFSIINIWPKATQKPIHI